MPNLLLGIVVTSSFPVSEFASINLFAPAKASDFARLSNNPILIGGVVATLYTETPHTITLPVVKQPEPIVVAKAPPAAKKTVNLTVNPAPVASSSGVEILDSGRKEYNNCVATVRLFHSYPQGGNPRATPQFINSKTPSIGAVAVQSTHVSIVESFTDTTITVKEGGVVKNKLNRRVIPRSAIKGYYK